MNAIEEYLRLPDIPPQVRRIYEGLSIDEKKATRPIEFIETFCKHSKGEYFGRPFKLLPFQKAFLAALYGHVNKDGRRIFREAFLYLSRKNGKSTLAAAIALYSLLTERGAEVYLAATKRDQANIIFNECYNMVRQSPELARLIRKRKSDLYYEHGLGVLKSLGRNSDTLDGLNASTVILDECHAIEGRELYEVLKQSQSARAEPLFLTITTAGTVREGIFDDLIAIARDPDESFLPVLYEGADYRRPETWILSNPGLGTIKRVDELSERVKRAEKSPVELQGLLCKDFNIISNVSKAWLSWDTLNNEAVFNVDEFKDFYGIGAFDLSMTTDLTCAAAMWVRDGIRFVEEHFWIPEDKLTDELPYKKWLARGVLSLCSGNVINPDDIFHWLRQFTLPYIFYDAYSARYLSLKMERAGYKMCPVRQGAKSLSIPMERLAADLETKRLNYNNNPITKWCLANTCCATDRNGNFMPVKRRNPKYRIDGTAALLDAYYGLIEKEETLNNANQG